MLRSTEDQTRTVIYLGQWTTICFDINFYSKKLYMSIVVVIPMV